MLAVMKREENTTFLHILRTTATARATITTTKDEEKKKNHNNDKIYKDNENELHKTMLVPVPPNRWFLEAFKYPKTTRNHLLGGPGTQALSFVER